MVERLAEWQHILVVELVDVALIDMKGRIVGLAAVHLHDSVLDIGSLAAAPKCTFASDYVDK